MSSNATITEGIQLIETTGVRDKRKRTVEAEDSLSHRLCESLQEKETQSSTKESKTRITEQVSSRSIVNNFDIELQNLKNKFLSSRESAQIDPLHDELKLYVDNLLNTVDSIITEKQSQEIEDIVDNCELIDTKRPIVLTPEQATRTY